MEHKKQNNNKQKRSNPTKKMKNKLVQPESSGVAIDSIPTSEDTGKDFETLMNAPISEGGHFIFKSEKEWTVDVSQYSEYFTLDLKTLSAAISCIPFNKYVNIDDKYFTIDQLTHMENAAEVGKQNYETLMKSLDTISKSSNADITKEDTEENKVTERTRYLPDSMKNLNVRKEESSSSTDKQTFEEELDFLLSLEEPTVQNTASVSSTAPTHCTDDLKIQLKECSKTKPKDLEKWLDDLIDS